MRSRAFLICSLCIILCLSVVVLNARGVSIAELSLEELIAEADHVAVVALRRTKVVEKDPFMVKEHAFVVNDVFKGNLAIADSISVYQDVGYGSPSYSSGQRFLLFAAVRTGEEAYYVVNGVQGLWPMDDDDNFTWWGGEHTLAEVIRSIPERDRSSLPPHGEGDSMEPQPGPGWFLSTGVVILIMVFFLARKKRPL